MHEKRLLLPFIVILAIVLGIAPLIASAYLLHLLITIMAFVTLVESWNIFSGNTGYILLGSAAFYGIGGYATATLWPILPIYVIIVVAGIVSAVVAFAVGYPCLRVRGPYFSILTFGLSQAIMAVVDFWQARLGSRGIMIKAYDTSIVYYLIMIVTSTTLLTTYLIRKSRFGVGLVAIKDDEDAAQACGVNTTLYKITAFAICAFYSGMAGALTVARLSYVDPSSIFNPMVSFQTAIMAIFGGTNLLLGPTIGAILLTSVQEILFGPTYVYYYSIMLAVIVIALVMFFPYGISESILQLTRKPRPQTN